MTSKDNKAWKEFEKLAARIERALSNDDVRVKCPDRILDNDTQTLREVDASIRYKVGSVEMLIILECRLRGRSQGTMWIEQLESKRRALGAVKCIAVSSSSFSKPAIKKANSLGIELRTIQSLDEHAIKQWDIGKTWTFKFDLDEVNFTFEDAMGGKSEEGFDFDHDIDDKLNKEVGSKVFSGKAKIYKIANDQKISLRDYVAYYFNQFTGDCEAEKIAFINLNIRKDLKWSVAGYSQHYILWKNKKYNLGGGVFWMKITHFEDFSLQFDSVHEYSNVDGVIAREFQLTLPQYNGKEKLMIHTSHLKGGDAKLANFRKEKIPKTDT